MRRRKIEEITRLIRTAAAMCDMNVLSDARRHLLMANSILERTERDAVERKKETKSDKPARSSSAAVAVKRIEEMIGDEMDKLSRPERNEVVNG